MFLSKPLNLLNHIQLMYVGTGFRQGFDTLPCATLDMYEASNDEESNIETVLELRLESGYNANERVLDHDAVTNWSEAALIKGRRGL